MSKIYNKYIQLKNSKTYVENTLYLFKYGIFFVFIDEDAKIISNYLHLKLSNLNNNVVKCGFPVNSLDKYMNLFKNIPYKIEIVNLENNTNLSPNYYVYYENIQKITNELASVNIDSLSISQTYDLLYKTQNKINNLNKEFYNEKKK